LNHKDHGEEKTMNAQITSSGVTWKATPQQRFADFMREQVQRIEKFRRHLSRCRRCEISHELAVSVWIERGYAAAFRRRFEVRA
jgi:hypothetical protein